MFLKFLKLCFITKNIFTFFSFLYSENKYFFIINKSLIKKNRYFYIHCKEKASCKSYFYVTELQLHVSKRMLFHTCTILNLEKKKFSIYHENFDNCMEQNSQKEKKKFLWQKIFLYLCGINFLLDLFLIHFTNRNTSFYLKLSSIN